MVFNMIKFKFDCKVKRQIVNVYRMIIYGYLKDFSTKGKNIKYGDNKKQYYKVFEGNKNKDMTVFFVHGGGWCQGSPKLYSAVGKYFSKKGYNTVIVGYRLVPKYKYPIQIEDCFKALKHYTENNNTSLIIGGYSAGSELASHLLLDTPRHEEYVIDTNRIKGLLSISGVLNFEECKSKNAKRLIKNYIEKNNFSACNPYNLINSQISSRVLCIHGANDTLINLENSRSFVKKLKSKNINSELIIIEGIDHEQAIDTIRGPGNKYSHNIFEFLKAIEDER